RAKSNLGLDHGGLEYTLLGAPVPGHDFLAQRVDWGRCLEGSAHELMSIEGSDEDALGEARAFLEGLLADGPIASREVTVAASPSPELEQQINDLEDSIAAKREQVKTLAALQYRTADAEEQLREMEQRLKTLQQSLARVGEEGARDE